MTPNTIELPNGFFDRHLHLREGKMMKLILPHSADQAWGGIIMPNLGDNPITTAIRAREYKEKIQKLNPEFQPFLTCYLTDNTDTLDLLHGYKNTVWSAAKLYPVGATTNSDQGVTSINKIADCLEAMERCGMPLLIHGEHVHEDYDPLDFERLFLERELVKGILERFPKLKVVLEHITTKEAVELVLSEKYNLWATVTPQHLMFSHKHLFQTGKVGDGTFKRGVRPRFWCMPILKTDPHREALLKAVCSGSKRFGAGTDSAPHANTGKYKDLGCGGCFTSPFALGMYATAFEQGGGLQYLQDFLGVNMLEEVYNLRVQHSETLGRRLSLMRIEQIVPVAELCQDGNTILSVEHLLAGETLPWQTVYPSE